MRLVDQTHLCVADRSHTSGDLYLIGAPQHLQQTLSEPRLQGCKVSGQLHLRLQAKLLLLLLCRYQHMQA